MLGAAFVLFNLIEYACVCWSCINRDGRDTHVWFALCEGISFSKFMLCVINPRDQPRHSSLTATPLTRWNRTILLRNISLKAKIKNSRSCHMRSGAGYTFAVFVQVKEPFGSWNKIYDNIGNMLFRIGTFILEVKKKFNSRPYNRISAPLSKGVFFSKFSTSSSVLCYIGVSPANT